MTDELSRESLAQMADRGATGEKPDRVRIEGVSWIREGLVIRIATLCRGAVVARWALLARGVQGGEVRYSVVGAGDLSADQVSLTSYGPLAADEESGPLAVLVLGKSWFAARSFGKTAL